MVATTGRPLRVDDLNMIDELYHWNPRLQSDSSGGQPNVQPEDGGRTVGMWWRSGVRIAGWCQILFGVDADPGGSSSYYFVDAPMPPDRSLIVGSLAGSYGNKIGSGHISDSSDGTNSITVSVEFLTFPRNGLALQLDQSAEYVNDNTPFTWAQNDRISFIFEYLADERVLA